LGSELRMCVKLSCRRRCSMNRDFVNWSSNFFVLGPLCECENVAWWLGNGKRRMGVGKAIRAMESAV